MFFSWVLSPSVPLDFRTTTLLIAGGKGAEKFSADLSEFYLSAFCSSAARGARNREQLSDNRRGKVAANSAAEVRRDSLRSEETAPRNRSRVRGVMKTWQG